MLPLFCGNKLLVALACYWGKHSWFYMHRISTLRCNSGNIKHNKAAIQEATNYFSSPAHCLWDFPSSGVPYKHFGVLKPSRSRKRATAEIGPAWLWGRRTSEILIHVMEMSGCSQEKKFSDSIEQVWKLFPIQKYPKQGLALIRLSKISSKDRILCLWQERRLIIVAGVKE